MEAIRHGKNSIDFEVKRSQIKVINTKNKCFLGKFLYKYSFQRTSWVSIFQLEWNLHKWERWGTFWFRALVVNLTPTNHKSLIILKIIDILAPKSYVSSFRRWLRRMECPRRSILPLWNHQPFIIGNPRTLQTINHW